MGEALTLLFFVGFFTIGKIVAVYKRRLTIEKFKKETLIKPLYEIVHDLEPLEYSYIIKGKLNYSAFVGQLISLNMGGYLSFTKKSGYLLMEVPDNIDLNNLSIANRAMVNLLINGISTREVFNIIKDDLKLATQDSLSKKGWLLEYRATLNEFIAIAMKRYARRILVLFFIVNAFFIFLFYALGVESDISTPLLAMVNISFLGLTYMYTIVLYTFNTSTYNNNLTIYSSDKYAKCYNDLHGLYIYLGVAGEDTMSPDYDDTLFKQLDSLYPYYVACGLDKNILNRNIKVSFKTSS